VWDFSHLLKNNVPQKWSIDWLENTLQKKKQGVQDPPRNIPAVLSPCSNYNGTDAPLLQAMLTTHCSGLTNPKNGAGTLRLQTKRTLPTPGRAELRAAAAYQQLARH
jgi:hypothetical protein